MRTELLLPSRSQPRAGIPHSMRLETQMKISQCIPWLLLLLLPPNLFGQALSGGAVVFALPEINAYQFTLMSGGYQNQDQENGQAQLNGFQYGNGTFHLWKNGGPGYCLNSVKPSTPGCRFDGNIGPMTSTTLSESCTQISFPITNGELRILTPHGVDVHKGLSATYSQTYCDVGGSMFMAGGTLVVDLE
jgi:hypothetical protein